MAAQDDINAAVTAIHGLLSDVAAQVATLGTDITAIQTEIANLQAGGVDTSALDTAVASIAATQASLDTAVQNVSAIATPPAPAP